MDSQSSATSGLGSNNARLRAHDNERLRAQNIDESDIQKITINDHDGNEVNLVWYPRHDRKSAGEVPPFAFQVYILDSVDTAQDPDLPAAFVAYFERMGGVYDGWPRVYGCYRFEVYSKTFSNILACVTHQRAEINHRNRHGIWPRVVPDWTRNDSGHKGKIIVIDRQDWRQSGVTLVRFDPAEYDQPRSSRFWSIVGIGDVDTVNACRSVDKRRLFQHLNRWWEESGGHWVEEDLQRLNDGGTSPVLYPALDPAAHFDAEHDDMIYELDGTELPGQDSPQNDDTDSEENVDCKIWDKFNKSELLANESEFPQLRMESYSDSFGLPITGVWNQRVSQLRPVFSMTIYLAYDMLPISPKALFSCLDKGLIRNQQWTLDVVDNMPSIEAALDYHARTSVRRTSRRTSQAESYTDLLLRKICKGKLPTELLVYIRDLIVPPAMPDYSVRPHRPFKYIFLFLDAKSVSTGPLLVYANHAPNLPVSSSLVDWIGYPNPRHYGEDSTNRDPENDGSDEPFYRCGPDFEIDLLQVINQRSWNRISDEVHVLWSMCSPRTALPGSSDPPSISIKLQIREDRPDAKYVGLPWLNMVFKLSYSQSIVVHIRPLLSIGHVLEAFDLVDLETGYVFSQPPLRLARTGLCYDSWSTENNLGLTMSRSSFITFGYMGGHIKTLRPGLEHQTALATIATPRAWWYYHDEQAKKLFVPGRQFILRLKEHFPPIFVPRWTHGTAHDIKGPYNLPPISVRFEDQEIRLTYQKDAHYERWRDECHEPPFAKGNVGIPANIDDPEFD